MMALATDPSDTLAQLEALAQSDRLPARDAARCAQLAETLRRPARVCLLGPARGDIRAVLDALMGADAPLAGSALPPALELRHGPTLRAALTLEDGTTLTQEGWPEPELLARDPVFLQLDLPQDALRAMSFLIISLDPAPAMHRPALSWAARRAEIVVWCTPAFSVADARIWSNVPERLTHHAYLVETQPNPQTPRHGAVSDFTGRLTLPLTEDGGPIDVAPLLSRLMSDIDDARLADVDAAHLMLHRLGHLPDARTPSKDAETGPCAAILAAPPTSAPAEVTDRLRRHLSEPVLYLRARARRLAEDLTWKAAEGDEAEGWATDVLAHCLETAEGLRDRAMGWPDDLDGILHLQAMIDDICDMGLLLQMEAGTEQAQDAAALLYQLRCAFDHLLAGQEPLQ